MKKPVVHLISEGQKPPFDVAQTQLRATHNWLSNADILAAMQMGGSLTGLLLEISNWAARALAIPGLKATGKYCNKRWWRRKFKKVFGQDSREYFLVFGNLEIHPEIQHMLKSANQQLGAFPFTKPTHPKMLFSAQKVASGCELRAVAYLGSALSLDGGIASKVIADDLIAGKLDIDFISFGAMSNLVTLNAFSNPANQFVDYDLKSRFFVSKKGGQQLCDVRRSCDYGVILKIHPEQFPRRTWIVCAGIGEWGTSGSAWFLAHKWRDIAKDLKDNDQFAFVIEVTPGQDESAILRVRVN